MILLRESWPFMAFQDPRTKRCRVVAVDQATGALRPAVPVEDGARRVGIPWPADVQDVGRALEFLVPKVETLTRAAALRLLARLAAEELDFRTAMGVAVRRRAPGRRAHS